MIGITILGSTGSIGVNTLDVISQHSDKYQVIALTANKGVERLAEQCRQWHPTYAVMADADSAEQLHKLVPCYPDMAVCWIVLIA